MPSYAKVIDAPGLVRDINSKAILNTDIESKKAFMKEREVQITNISIQEKLRILQEDVTAIKLMINELSLLKCKHSI